MSHESDSSSPINIWANRAIELIRVVAETMMLSGAQSPNERPYLDNKMRTESTTI